MAQVLDVAFERGAIGAVDAVGPVTHPDTDAEVLEPVSPGSGQRLGKDAHQQCDVRRAARDRAGHAELWLAEHAGRGWNVSAERNEAVGRLVPEYAAEVGRDADRSADVAAELERGEAGR